MPPGQSQTPREPQVSNPLSVMQPGERVLCEIKRHPIGLIGTYIAAFVLILVAAILAFAVAPTFLTQYDQNEVLTVGALGFILVAVATFGFVWLTNTVYRGNRWIVTSDSITQVTQVSLFNKQSSQLSLANLEDISAEQNGIFAHMWNYGVLRAETAGERSKFTLLYCPNPNYYAQCILDAREKFEQLRGARGGSPDGGVNISTQG